MKSLKEQIDDLMLGGYSTDTARAKVVHDAVLLAMHKSGFKSNSTIKGGVVMSSLTGDVRRATMDIDFIHYSLIRCHALSNALDAGRRLEAYLSHGWPVLS